MKKPIIFILYISIACSIGFIGGVIFGDHYKKDVILDTISQNNDFQSLINRYQLTHLDLMSLKDLEEIQNIYDVESLKEKYKRKGLSDVELFRKQANAMNPGALNPSVLQVLKTGIAKMETDLKNSHNQSIKADEK